MKKILLLYLIFVVLVGCADNTANKSIADDLPTEPVTETGDVKDISITAFNWGFEMTPVTINKGDRVKLIVQSREGTHGFSLPAFNVKLGPLEPNKPQIVEFIADKSGSFDFACNYYCGEGHAIMKGTLVVS